MQGTKLFWDNYSKTLNIEAVTMLDMAKKDLLPAFSAYTKQLSDTLLAKKEAAPGVDCSYEEEQIKKVSGLCGSMYQKTKELEESLMALRSSGI